MHKPVFNKFIVLKTQIIFLHNKKQCVEVAQTSRDICNSQLFTVAEHSYLPGRVRAVMSVQRKAGPVRIIAVRVM